MSPTCCYQIDVVPRDRRSAVPAEDPTPWHMLYTGTMPPSALEYFVWGLVRSHTFARVRVFCTTHPGHVLYDSVAVGVLGLLTAPPPPPATQPALTGVPMSPPIRAPETQPPTSGGG